MGTESRRKLIHLLLTGFPLTYSGHAHFRRLHLTVLLTLLASWYVSECMRVFRHARTPTGLLLELMTRSGRSAELIPFQHPNWLIGYLAAAIVFPQPHIVPGICVLTFGDSAAAIAGCKGRTKSIRGTFAGLVASFVTCFVLKRDLLAAVGASSFGMTAEFLSRRIKDNYTIPLAAGLGSIVGAFVGHSR